ncbi:MAG: alpha-ribazole phosphatase [Bacteroidaceae bacterium]|nr:alpha-ribazole phosphatase [Bacteroidaceae bacterium]
MELFLIRHTSVAVPRGTCYGWTDVPVSEHFEEEAAACREQLQGITFDRVYTSPLTRARQLAAFCGYPDAIEEPRMKEMHMGDWEMLRFDDIHDPDLQKYFDHFLDHPTRNGESFRDLYARVTAFIEELRADPATADARVAVFCHGGPIMCALAHAGVVPLQEVYNHIPDYASITRLTL